jgi:AcrR family transcriptional regulator
MTPGAAISSSTRERILDSALALLHDQGYDRLTQPRVASAAGITQGHLTYYFPTRSALLLAVAEHSLRSSMKQALHRNEGQADVEAIIRLVRQALLEKQRTRTILGLVIASDRDREIKKPLRQTIVHAREIATALLRQLDTEPTPQLAILLHACLVGLSTVTFAYDTPKSDREMGDAAETLLRLLATPPSRAGAQKQRKSKTTRG